MDTIADYEKWKAARSAPSRLSHWLDNPEGVTPVPLEQTVVAWAIMLAVVGLAGYLLFRYRSHIRSVVKSSIATMAIVVIRITRFLRAEADDIRALVSCGLDQPSLSEGQTAIKNADCRPGRLRLAGRMFFNLAIAPLLLGCVLIGGIAIASKVGLID